MTSAARQASRRQRLRQEGMVDIRVEVEPTLRDALRYIAARKGGTMKSEIITALQNHVVGSK